ncbi:hypothetical protein QE320_gp008 [Pseudomonas phage EM]|uniref:Uncharacterized protein n=1 Tax=Pseudomonas phage EM TaxID=2936914 RepID=A0AAE9KTV9_9CAUD|nr:hypothetical protein QE320_gp008 [Pseudomonas phage EM]UPW35810.1 hypothetical protein EM_008 [Pseudomonas phage EM]
MEKIEYFIRVDNRAENIAVQEWLAFALGVEFPYSAVGSHLNATALFWTSNCHGGMAAIDDRLALSYTYAVDVDEYLASDPVPRKEVEVDFFLDGGKLRVDLDSVSVKYHGPASEQAEQEAPKVSIIRKADIPAGEYSLEDLYAIIAQLEEPNAK